VLKSGGVNSFTTWKQAEWTVWVSKAMATLPGCPKWPTWDEAVLEVYRGNPGHEEAWVEGKMKQHGFVDVIVTDSHRVRTVSPAEFAQTFGGPMVQNIATNFWNTEECAEWGAKIAPTLIKYFEDNDIKEVDFVMNPICCKRAHF